MAINYKNYKNNENIENKILGNLKFENIYKILTEEERKILNYLVFEGRTIKETANILQLTPSQIKTKKRKILTTIKKYLIENNINEKSNKEKRCIKK